MERRLETDLDPGLEGNLAASVEENLEAGVDIRMVPDRGTPSPPRGAP